MPCRRSPLILLLPVVIALGSTACALHRQEPVSALSPGAVLRVTRACPPARHHEICPRYQGTLVSIDRDTLKLRSSPGGPIQALAASDVSRLERRSGKRNLILLGALVGLNAGFLIGWAATSGALAGGVVGALVHPDRWSRIAWPQH